MKRDWFDNLIPYSVMRRYSDFKYWCKETFYYKPHRAIHGWAPNDTWNLDSYLSKVTSESLRYLAKHSHGYPGRNLEYTDGRVVSANTFDEWNTKLNEIASLFDEYYNFEENSINRWNKLHKKHNIPTFSDLIKSGDGSYDQFTSLLNDKKYNLPPDVSREFYLMEDKRKKELLTKMKELFEIYEHLWD